MPQNSQNTTTKLLEIRVKHKSNQKIHITMLSTTRMEIPGGAVFSLHKETITVVCQMQKAHTIDEFSTKDNMRTAIAINESGLHPKRYHELKQQFGEDECLLGRSDAFYETLGLSTSVWKRLQKPKHKKIDTTLKWAEKNQVTLLRDQDKHYPKQLKELPCWPPLLYVKGSIRNLDAPGVGIVGSRNASFYGLEVTKKFAGDLAKLGYSIISGLAIGVDGTAHEACLNANQISVAVIGLGVDNITPIQNRHLAKRIEKQGCIISEMPLQTTYQKQCFPRRNRLISALSVATLVTEAQTASGTLTTAQYSIDLHRPVMAIPGKINQPQAAGCHQLIQDGAHLVTRPLDCHHIITQHINQ